MDMHGIAWFFFFPLVTLQNFEREPKYYQVYDSIATLLSQIIIELKAFIEHIKEQ